MQNFCMAIALCLFLGGCIANTTRYKKISTDPCLYARTVKELNNVVMQNNFPPIVASRNYLYANIAAYEVMVKAYPEKYISLAEQLNGLGQIPQPPSNQAIDFELASFLAFCQLGEAVTFPEGSMQVYRDSVLLALRNQGLSASILAQTKLYAQTVGNAILEWSKKDNYAQTRTFPKYAVLDSPGRWVPTPPMYAQALEPHWREIRTLVLDSANQFIPPPPPSFDIENKKSRYYQEVLKVKEAGENLTEEQKHIAEFWDDLGTRMNVSGHVMFMTKKFSPPGHWMNIVGIAAKKAQLPYDETVYAYAKTAIAVFDAFIQCWDEKYRSKRARPETVINQYLDPNWRPFLQTPPFPEYTCGHSTVSAAAAEVLTDVFGDNFSYTDTSELEFGIKNRSFSSFRQAAQENNKARFYGGIHFENSCLVSNEYGRKVGILINQQLKMKK